MIRMGKETKLTSEEVISKAVAFFGPGGWGLEVEERAACCARFVGTGGHVFVQASDDEKAAKREVTVEGREWENQIKQFMREI
jgi:hypothetical protein